MKLQIRATNVHVDGGGVPSADFEILLRFVSDFLVSVAGNEVFREVEFPFIEFASQVSAWLDMPGTQDFDFESMDSALQGLVYFHRTNEGNWSVGSTRPDSAPALDVTDDELRQGLNAFLAWVPLAVDAFGVDVRSLMQRGHSGKSGLAD